MDAPPSSFGKGTEDINRTENEGSGRSIGDDGPEGESCASSRTSRSVSMMMMKRGSLMADDLANFDPASLEADDDWSDIFDGDQDGEDEDGEDEDGEDEDDGTAASANAGAKPTLVGSSASDASRPTPAASASASSSKDGTDGTNATDPLDASALMPPPARPAAAAASDKQQARSLSILSSSSLSSFPGLEGISPNRPPLDHSITRRIKTSHNFDRADSAPPTWHSQAADMPHRQAMVQDM
jgi:hypothetical protein